LAGCKRLETLSITGKEDRQVLCYTINIISSICPFNPKADLRFKIGKGQNQGDEELEELKLSQKL